MNESISRTRILGGVLICTLIGATAFALFREHALELRLAKLETVPQASDLVATPEKDSENQIEKNKQLEVSTNILRNDFNALKQELAPLYKNTNTNWTSEFTYNLGDLSPSDTSILSVQYPEPAMRMNDAVGTDHWLEIYYSATNARFGIETMDTETVQQNFPNMASTCDEQSGDKAVTINGLTFCKHDEVIGGMESAGRWVTYGLQRDGKWIVFSFQFTTQKYCDGKTNCDTVDARYASFYKFVDSIMNTVHISPISSGI